MKKLSVILALVFVYNTQAQSIKVNLPKESKPIVINIPQNQIFKLDKAKDTILTTNKAIYRNVEYPVYAIKESGKMYICLTSKSGKYYRKYIK